MHDIIIAQLVHSRDLWDEQQTCFVHVLWNMYDLTTKKLDQVNKKENYNRSMINFHISHCILEQTRTKMCLFK